MGKVVNGFRVLTAGLAVAGLIFSYAGAPAHALSISSSRDCDANAVIRCGALTTSELTQRFQQNSGASAIFNYFGISNADVNAMGTTAVAGQVTDQNTVIVDGKTVATNAVTAGRQNIPGSTKVTHMGTTFYMRPPSVSFVSSPLAAYVVMNNGRFSHAVLASCGNPVIATPTTKPKPAPAATKPTSTPTPKVITTPVTIVNNVQQQQQQQQQTPTAAAQTQSATTAATTSTPAQAQSQSQSQPAVQATTTQPTSLPKTGPSNALAIGLLAAIPSAILHYFYKRIRLKQTT